MSISRLSSLIPVTATRVYDDLEFREVLLKHLPILKSKNIGTLDVTQRESAMFECDFHGLLNSKGVSPHMWWLFTALNGLNCSTDYTADKLLIITPDMDYLEKIVSLYLSSHK